MMNLIETYISEIWMLLVVVSWIVYLGLESLLIYAALSGKLSTIRKFANNWDYPVTWLILAAGGLYAVFPNWYAHLWSTAYMSLILILCGNVLKGAALEFLHGHDSRKFVVMFQSGMVIMIMGLIGLIYPAIDMVMNVPHQGVVESQLFLLYGTVFFLPMIIGYGVYNYYTLFFVKEK